MQKTSVFSVLCLGVASAFPGVSQAEVMQTLDTPAGQLQITKGEYEASVLSLGDTVLLEEDRMRMRNAGAMGVLVEAHHGGKFCPEAYYVVDPVGGELRQIRSEADNPYIMGQCLTLVEVLPQLGMLVFAPYVYNQQAIVVTWDGYQFTETTIEQKPSPAAGPGADVERWTDQPITSFLADPSERARLETFVPGDDLSWILSEMGQGDVMTLENGYLSGTACSRFECGSVWAKLAVRVSDGVVFYRLHNQSEEEIDPGFPEFLR